MFNTSVALITRTRTSPTGRRATTDKKQKNFEQISTEELAHSSLQAAFPPSGTIEPVSLVADAYREDF